MARHLMIDLETLGTEPSTAILTIGAVIFDPRGKGVIDQIEIRPTLEDQTEIYGRTINESTLEWWSRQSPDAIHEAMGEENRIPYKDAMEVLCQFAWNTERVWSNGSIFDVAVIEHALRELEITYPWQFWNVRDCRTIYELAGVSLKDPKYKTFTSHKAVEDAVHQSLVIQDAYSKLIAAGFNHIR